MSEPRVLRHYGDLPNAATAVLVLLWPKILADLRAVVSGMRIGFPENVVTRNANALIAALVARDFIRNGECVVYPWPRPDGKPMWRVTVQVYTDAGHDIEECVLFALYDEGRVRECSPP